MILLPSGVILKGLFQRIGRIIGFVSHSRPCRRLRSRACRLQPAPSKLALFATITSRRTGPRATLTPSQISHPSQVWLCFARLPLPSRPACPCKLALFVRPGPPRRGRPALVVSRELALFRTAGSVQSPCGPAALGWDHPRGRGCYLTLHTSNLKLLPPNWLCLYSPPPSNWLCFARLPVRAASFNPQSRGPARQIGFVSQNPSAQECWNVGIGEQWVRSPFPPLHPSIIPLLSRDIPSFPDLALFRTSCDAVHADWLTGMAGLPSPPDQVRPRPGSGWGAPDTGREATESKVPSHERGTQAIRPPWLGTGPAGLSRLAIQLF
jgi:hypothetical protein